MIITSENKEFYKVRHIISCKKDYICMLTHNTIKKGSSCYYVVFKEVGSDHIIYGHVCSSCVRSK